MTGSHDAQAASLRELAKAMATMPIEVAACASCSVKAYAYLPYPCIGEPDVTQAVLHGLERHPLGRAVALYLIATVKPDPEHEIDGSEPAEVWDVAAGRITITGTLQECLDTLAEGLLCLCNAGDKPPN